MLSTFSKRDTHVWNVIPIEIKQTNSCQIDKIHINAPQDRLCPMSYTRRQQEKTGSRNFSF